MHDQQAVTTSLRVAEVFHKEHRNVLASIGGLLKNQQTQQMFVEGTYINEQNGQSYPMYYMNRDGFTLLAMGFTGSKAMEFKLAYIQAFNEMEQAQPKLLQTPEEMLDLVVQVSDRTAKRVKKVETRMTDLEENQLLPSGQYSYIGKQANKAVAQYVAVHHLKLNREQRSLFYHDMNGGLNAVLGIRQRTQIRIKDFDKACEFVSSWVPGTATLMQVKALGESQEA